MARFVRPAAALMFAAMVSSAGAAQAPAAGGSTAATSVIEGVWLTAAKSEITVSACPEDFCGAITKIVVPDDVYKQNKQAIDSMGATQFTDQMNKDPNLRGRSIMGLQILTLHPNKDKPKIFDGQIYNPQDGNTYSGYVEVLSQDKIRLNGCILYNIICKGEDWTRVPQPEAADASTTTAAPGKPGKPAGTAHAASGGNATSAGSFQ